MDKSKEDLLKLLIERRIKILKLCESPKTTNEVRDALGLKYTTVYDDFVSLCKFGWVQKVGKKHKTIKFDDYTPPPNNLSTSQRAIKPHKPRKVYDDELPPGKHEVRPGVIVHGMQHTNAPLKKQRIHIGSTYKALMASNF